MSIDKGKFMPYLRDEEKKVLEDLITTSVNKIEEIGGYCYSSGDLNYVITKIILGYFKTRGGRYKQINDVVGAMEGAKLEFYRKVVAPYEEIKESENGSVYKEN